LSRVLFVGAPYEVVSRESRTLAQCFEATGRNTGNLLIGYGLFTQLRYDKLESYRYAMTPEYVEENFDQVVIAAANFLYPGFDFTPVSSFLDKIKLPVFMVGLGAQLPASSSELKNIPEGTWRLVEIAAERSHSVGVRGAFTADQLMAHGIKNVQVTGCPSLYTNLSDPIPIREPRVPERIVVNGSRNVVGHSSHPDAAKRAEVSILQWAMAHQAPYVLQNEQPEMQIAAGHDLAEHRQALKSLSTFFARDAGDLADYYQKHAKVFFSIDSWFSWIANQEFCVGTRFHGNVAALLNGVPAVVVTHDSRTRELCEFAAIPSVDVAAINKFDPKELLASADLDRYRTTLLKNTAAYASFLDDNRISHKMRHPVRGDSA
jgi:hypothetical protein